MSKVLELIDAKIRILKMSETYASCPECVRKDIEEYEAIKSYILLLEKDNQELHNRIKQNVSEHYQDFMKDYDVLLGECMELLNAVRLLTKHLSVVTTYAHGDKPILERIEFDNRFENIEELNAVRDIINGGKYND